MQKGFLITFEGIDKSGKTTQIALLESYLKDMGYETVLTREPGGTRIGENIREIILNSEYQEMDIITELLLYGSSRAQLVSEVIIPSIKAGKIVLCDRFNDSTIAYQGYGRGIDVDTLVKINEIILGDFQPDRTFLIDISVEESNKRYMDVEVKDRIESEKNAFYKKVIEGYHKLANDYPDRIKLIDGVMDVDSIHNIIKQNVNNILKGR